MSQELKRSTPTRNGCEGIFLRKEGQGSEPNTIAGGSPPDGRRRGRKVSGHVDKVNNFWGGRGGDFSASFKYLGRTVIKKVHKLLLGTQVLKLAPVGGTKK